MAKQFSKRDVSRALAAKVLGLRNAKEATQIAMDALMDDASAVREHAALALGKDAAPVAVTPLFQLLIDDDEMVRYAAGVALACLGDERAVPFVLDNVMVIKIFKSWPNKPSMV